MLYKNRSISSTLQKEVNSKGLIRVLDELLEVIKFDLIDYEDFPKLPKASSKNVMIASVYDNIRDGRNLLNGFNKAATNKVGQSIDDSKEVSTKLNDLKISKGKEFKKVI